MAVPNSDTGIYDLENNLETVFTTPSYSFKKVYVRMPKFRIETEFSLKHILQSFNIINVFDRDLADLSGMVKDNDKLFLSNAYHRVGLNVTEGGVEASSKTKVVSEERGREEFIVDRPFIFFIKREGVVIFAGRVLDL